MLFLCMCDSLNGNPPNYSTMNVYKIGLGNFDGVYLRYYDGKLEFSDDGGRVIYFVNSSDAESVINKLAKKFGEIWRTRMYVIDCFEHIYEDDNIKINNDSLFKYWDDYSYGD